jgi:hypothetical protein
MKRRFSFWLAGAFIVAFLAVGVPYWQVPYNKVSLPTTLIAPGFFVMIFAAALARFAGKHSFFATLLVVALAAPAAVVVRVVVETSQDPTSHNLWPFEVVLALFVGLAASLLGAVAGSLPAFLARGGPRGGAG